MEDTINTLLAMAGKMTAIGRKANSVPRGQRGIFVPLPDDQIEAASRQTEKEGYAHYQIRPENPDFEE